MPRNPLGRLQGGHPCWHARVLPGTTRGVRAVARGWEGARPAGIGGDPPVPPSPLSSSSSLQPPLFCTYIYMIYTFNDPNTHTHTHSLNPTQKQLKRVCGRNGTARSPTGQWSTLNGQRRKLSRSFPSQARISPGSVAHCTAPPLRLTPLERAMRADRLRATDCE